MLGAQVFQQDGKAAEQTVAKLADTAEKAAPKLKKTGTELDKTGESAKKAKDPLDATAKSTKEVGDQAEKTTPKVKATGLSVEQLAAKSRAASTTVGTAFLGIGAAIAAAAAVAVAKYANFDQGMSNLRATTQASTKEQKQLADAALDAGARTTFNARQAADAQNELAKAGLNVHRILSGGLNGSLVLAAAGELGVARAAEIAATTLQQFQLDGDKAGHVADVLAAGANKAIGSVDDLANGLKFVGPVAHAMNISLEETVGTLAIFAASGVVGEQGGTALRGVLSSLTSPSRQARDELERLNVQLYDQQGNFLGIDNLAGQLQKSYAGLTGHQKDNSLGIIFGNEQITAARLLMQSGKKGVEDYTKAVDDSGYAAKVAADKQNNLAGDIEKVGGSLDSALVKTGGQANGALRDMAKTTANLIDYFGGLSPEVQGAGLVIAVGAAAVFLFAGAALVVVPRIVAFKVALTELSENMRGTAIAGGVIGIAITALVTILGAVAAANANAEAKAKSYADTLEVGSNKVTKATRDLAKANLATEDSFLWFKSDSTYTAAKKLGLSLTTVTDAATGNVKALKKVRDALDVGAVGTDKYNAALKRSGLNDTDFALASDAVTKGVMGESDSLKEAIRVAEQKQSVDGDSASSNADVATSYGTVTEAVDGVVTSIQDLSKELNALNGVHLDARAAARALEQAYDDFDASIAKNGKTLDITTEKGRANQAALDDIAKAAGASGQAIVDAGGGYDEYGASLEASKGQIDARIAKLGITGQAASDLSDMILHIPTKAEFTAYAHVDDAMAKLDALRTKYLAVGGLIMNQAGLDALEKAAAAPPKKANPLDKFQISKADGGKVNFYANGGAEHHVAQFAAAGTTRVWAEPETEGEWYIPAAKSKRQQSTQVLAAAAQEFGYQLVPAGGQRFADGGSTSTSSTTNTGPAWTGDVILQGTGIDQYEAGEIVANAVNRQIRRRR
jgi:TP901 family phage tail tape measure protein